MYKLNQYEKITACNSDMRILLRFNTANQAMFRHLRSDGVLQVCGASGEWVDVARDEELHPERCYRLNEEKYFQSVGIDDRRKNTDKAAAGLRAYLDIIVREGILDKPAANRIFVAACASLYGCSGSNYIEDIRRAGFLEEGSDGNVRIMSFRTPENRCHGYLYYLDL